MTRRKNIYSFILSDSIRLVCLTFCVAVAQTIAAQKYVPTEMSKQKEALEKVEKANRPKKLVYAVEKKNFIQKFKEDSTAVLNGVQINVDLVGTLQSLLSDKKYFEAGARLSIKDRIFPAIELGYGSTDYHEIVSDTYYKCGGLYGRLGFDLNLMKDKHDIYRLFAGARAAGTSFNFDISMPNSIDPVWGTNAGFDVKDARCNYLWLEFLAGVDAKILGPIHLGWTMRYKRRMSHSYEGIDKAWYVPGYGNDGSSGFGATFTVGLEI